MSINQINKIRRLSIPKIQVKLKQENQILFLKCNSPKSEHKMIEKKYKAKIDEIQKELDELFRDF